MLGVRVAAIVVAAAELGCIARTGYGLAAR